MYQKVSALRLGDVLAEPPIAGRVIGLRLNVDGKTHIDFIAVRDGQPYHELEIRWPADHIEIEPFSPIAERIAELDDVLTMALQHEADRKREHRWVKRGKTTVWEGLSRQLTETGVALHVQVERLEKEARLAEANGKPWEKADKDRLGDLCERLLRDVFGMRQRDLDKARAS